MQTLTTLDVGRAGLKPGPALAPPFLTLVFPVVVWALIEIALHAVSQFRGKSSLDLPPAESARYPGAVGSLLRIGRAGLLPSAFFKFPTIHNVAP